MKRFHLIFGLFAFILFLLTGQYMGRYHNHLEGMEDGMRLLYRTRHIFILLASLIYLGIGFYYTPPADKWRRWVQLIGSSLLTIGTFLLLVAFIYEPKARDLATPYTHHGLNAILAGV